jgi:teichuronic acid biosynthesis glycosyltransferase TuaG
MGTTTHPNMFIIACRNLITGSVGFSSFPEKSMSTVDLVSIITPAFKAARFVDESIRSVLAQDHCQWEMIIVDDCSPDETGQRVLQWAERDHRIRLISQQQNGGPAAARNTALANSSGRYAAFLDSDDYWLPGKLSHQLAFMRQSGAALSFTSFRRITEDGARIGRQIKVPKKLVYAQLLANTAIATSTVIVDRAKTGPLQMQNVYYDDFVLWLSLLRRGHIALGLNEDLMRYRVVGKSVSRNKLKSASEVWKTYRVVEKLGLLHAAWCFTNYTARGWLKYARF